jgi:hypothetical protein
MASVGCLFLGSQAAVQRGRQIFETLNKVILTSVSDTFSSLVKYTLTEPSVGWNNWPYTWRDSCNDASSHHWPNICDVIWGELKPTMSNTNLTT